MPRDGSLVEGLEKLEQAFQTGVPVGLTTGKATYKLEGPHPPPYDTFPIPHETALTRHNTFEVALEWGS